MHIELGHDQAVIYSFLTHQFIVGPHLGDAVFIDDHDAVRLSQSRQPVGNRKRGASLDQAAESLLDLIFRFGIQAAGGLIQNKQPWIVQYSTAIAIRCRSPPDKVYPFSPT